MHAVDKRIERATNDRNFQDLNTSTLGALANYYDLYVQGLAAHGIQLEFLTMFNELGGSPLFFCFSSLTFSNPFLFLSRDTGVRFQ